MLFAALFPSVFRVPGRAATSRRRQSPGRLPLHLEDLEGRSLLSVFTVVDLGDASMGSGLQGDLRYCIDQANSNPDLSNRIVFQLGLTGTITLTQGKLVVTKPLEINGPGADLLTVSGNHQSGVFDIEAPDGRTVVLSDLTIADGTGSGMFGGQPAGGGLFNDSASVTLNRVVVTRNTLAQGFGGGIFNLHGTMTINAATISNTFAGSGLTNWNGSATISDTTITGTSAGDGIESAGTMVLRGCLIMANKGGVSSSGTLTVANCTFTANGFAHFFVGGLSNHGRATVTDSVFLNNHAEPSGGGIFSYGGDLTVTGSTFTGNSAAYGGAIAALQGQLHLTNSTLSGNTAVRQGGGVIADLGANFIEITSSTITLNTTTSGAFPDWGGGGLYADSTRALIRNTIIAENQSAGNGQDVNGDVTSLGYNLVGQTEESSGWVASDQTGTADAPLDPRLGPLQDNGGPTATHALLVDSPALHRGDPSVGGSPDQRGSLRQPFANHDIGAFEARDATQFRLLAPDSVAAGERFALTVVALDQWGNLASTYTGTVHFSSTDLSAQLPDDTAFSGDDAGAHTFGLTLATPGQQDIAVVDTAHPRLSGGATVNVLDASTPREGSGSLADGDGASLPGLMTTRSGGSRRAPNTDGLSGAPVFGPFQEMSRCILPRYFPRCSASLAELLLQDDADLSAGSLSVWNG